MTATDFPGSPIPLRDGQERFVRSGNLAPAPPPPSVVGPAAWVREHLFTGPLNIMLTIVLVALALWVIPPLVRFLFIDAAWSGADREACINTAQRPEIGACWAFVRDRAAYFTYGSYPPDQHWRVNVFFALLAIGIVWLASLKAPRRDIGAIYFFVVLPVVSFYLLSGAEWLGLPVVGKTIAIGVIRLRFP